MIIYPLWFESNTAEQTVSSFPVKSPFPVAYSAYSAEPSTKQVQPASIRRLAVPSGNSKKRKSPRGNGGCENSMETTSSSVSERRGKSTGIQRAAQYEADNAAAAKVILEEKLPEYGEGHGLVIWARAVIRRQTEARRLAGVNQ